MLASSMKLSSFIHSISRKWVELKGFGYRREFEQFCPLLLRCQEPKEISALGKCFRRYGYSWNWLTHYDDDATISHNNENLSACEQDLHLRDIERSHEREARAKGETNVRCGERKRELFVYFAAQDFTTHSRVHLPLEMVRLLPVHNISW